VTLLHLFDGARLLSLECAVLWVPALIVGMALGFALGSKSKRPPPSYQADVSGHQITGP
jgi:hypothetical protein